MRLLAALVLATVLAGCATTSPDMSIAPVSAEMNARADSLLALQPGQLTPADVVWLQTYHARSQAPAARKPDAAILFLGLAGAMGVALILWVLPDAVNG